MVSARTALAALTAMAASAPAHAAVVISAAPTQNMNCSNGTCVPTATNAVLNASDLASDLSQFGNLRVITTGTGVEANNIEVKATFSTPDSTSLTLEARKAITVGAGVTIGSGTAELELQTDGQLGALSFGQKGHITFGNLSDIFGINGDIFTLVGSVQGLASAVAANPSGAFALANSYDAGQDGTYATSPVATTFRGQFTGLGNTVSNLTVSATVQKGNLGFFSTLQGGNIESLRLHKANISVDDQSGSLIYVGTVVGFMQPGKIDRVNADGRISGTDAGPREIFAGGMVGGNLGAEILHSSAAVSIRWPGADPGGLVGLNMGNIADSHASGVIHGSGDVGLIGGLAAANEWESGEHGIIRRSYATGDVSSPNGREGSQSGGLVGENEGVIRQCFAAGTVKGTVAGGLVGVNAGNDNFPATITDSYATGAVFSSKVAGGFSGDTQGAGAIKASYSTGPVKGRGSAYVGGFLGEDFAEGTTFHSYWDTTSSGITDPSQGAGNVPNDSGITGLTTAQFQSGLPSGFDPAIWAEDPNINDGLPYLINNPPPK